MRKPSFKKTLSSETYPLPAQWVKFTGWNPRTTTLQHKQKHNLQNKPHPPGKKPQLQTSTSSIFFSRIMLQNQPCGQEQVHTRLTWGTLGFQDCSEGVLFNVTQSEEIRTNKWALGETISHIAEQSMVKEQRRWHLEPNRLFTIQGHVRVQGSVSSHWANDLD